MVNYAVFNFILKNTCSNFKINILLIEIVLIYFLHQFLDMQYGFTLPYTSMYNFIHYHQLLDISQEQNYLDNSKSI